jgi:hypothetical protein
MASTYQAGLTRWDVGRWGRKVLARIGAELEEVCYLNAARCQHPGIGVALQRLYQRRWPIRETLRFLRPRLLLITSRTALVAAGPEPWPCMVAALSQRNGRLLQTSPWQPQSDNLSPSAWLGELENAMCAQTR